MSSIDKEKILVELREYHLTELPEKLSSETLTSLRAEFAEFEDKFINMVLSLVNGKDVFVDLKSEISHFQKGLKSNTDGKAKDIELFNQKIDALLKTLAIAEESSFKLRKVRAPRNDLVKRVAHVPQKNYIKL